MHRFLSDPARVRLGGDFPKLVPAEVKIDKQSIIAFIDNELFEKEKPVVEKKEPSNESVFTWAGYIKDLFDNAFIEFLAALILLSSAIYEPHMQGDILAQLVSGAAIVVVMMTLKDKNYFCPDGSFMVTVVLMCAGAYTGANKGVTWREKVIAQAKATLQHLPDIFVRWTGQILAFIVLYYGVVQPRRNSLKDAPFEQIMGESLEITNEFLATMMECVGTAFCIMPLLRPDGDARDPNYENAFASKTDTDPPTNKRLYVAATSLGLLRIVLERLFRTTMNPFAFVLQCEIIGQECSHDKQTAVIGAQFCGLFVAGVYSYMYLPTPKVMSKIFKND